mmetsp:Transcript_70917/g.169833  ORF Transcript_70917/g.169833 Transcript_70917/m.169833 type:complete len:541 (+) Transcript_70917:188-1810(+)|eukprot:CAMPEP_0178434094 /NCGR_PEP_ID=MMETSP0689_2-20121128/33247_1 /TAXON_ID=160604 /ORGANISM="Amphidinium massartii, Strain CS-259" /LENGTH=540 /DNA_ID=CAMNT_0020056149 /DNA_START=93 /DNA_END=1715 /DNA_ORIENTATION=-
MTQPPTSACLGERRGGRIARRQWRRGEGHRSGGNGSTRSSIGRPVARGLGRNFKAVSVALCTMPAAELELREAGKLEGARSQSAAVDECALGVVSGLFDDAIEALLFASGEGFIDPGLWDPEDEREDNIELLHPVLCSPAALVLPTMEPAIAEEQQQQQEDDDECCVDLTVAFSSHVSQLTVLPNTETNNDGHDTSDDEDGFMEVLSAVSDDDCKDRAAMQANDYILAALAQAGRVMRSSCEEKDGEAEEPQEQVLDQGIDAIGSAEVAFNLLASVMDFGMTQASQAETKMISRLDSSRASKRSGCELTSAQGLIPEEKQIAVAEEGSKKPLGASRTSSPAVQLSPARPATRSSARAVAKRSTSESGVANNGLALQSAKSMMDIQSESVRPPPPRHGLPRPHSLSRLTSVRLAPVKSELSGKDAAKWLLQADLQPAAPPSAVLTQSHANETWTWSKPQQSHVSAMALDLGMESGAVGGRRRSSSAGALLNLKVTKRQAPRVLPPLKTLKGVAPSESLLFPAGGCLCSPPLNSLSSQMICW